VVLLAELAKLGDCSNQIRIIRTAEITSAATAESYAAQREIWTISPYADGEQRLSEFDRLTVADEALHDFA
jgi:hypothetical protein